MSLPSDPIPPDAEFEAMLGAHFSAALEPHAGKAPQAFREHLGRQRRMRLFRFSSVVAFAAGILIAWGLASTWFAGPAPSPGLPAPVTLSQQVKPPSPTMVQSASWSRVMDDGMGLVANHPVRQFRRNIVEEVDWYDQRTQARVRQTTPRQEIFLIGVQTD